MTNQDKVKEPLFHIVKRDAIPAGKAWGIRALAILAALVVLNLLWARVVAPLFGTEVVGLVADSVVKTVVLALAALAAVYGWKVSPSINDIVDRVLKRRKA